MQIKISRFDIKKNNIFEKRADITFEKNGTTIEVKRARFHRGIVALFLRIFGLAYKVCQQKGQNFVYHTISRDAIALAKSQSGTSLVDKAVKDGKKNNSTSRPYSKTSEETATEFWENHLFNPDLHRTLEMCLNFAREDKADLKGISTYLLANYIEFQQKTIPGFNLPDNIKANLKKNFEIQLSPLLDSRTDKNQALSNGDQLNVYNTKGDGSCGLHALLGTPNQQGTYGCNAKSERELFCTWIADREKKNNRHECIDNVLEDYFLRFDIAPALFKTAKVKNIYAKHQEMLADLDKEISKLDVLEKEKRSAFLKQKDKVVSDFTKDNTVIQAYLKNLRQVGTYLLQDELIAAAACFNRTLYLYQPGWGDDSKKVTETLAYKGSPSAPIIHIWYNGRNHYERADKVPVDKISS